MDRLKEALSKIATNVRSQQGNQLMRNQDNDTTATTRRFRWPPVLSAPPLVLGEVKDVSQRPYPRDMGRSVQLGGHVYYMFGDTFCFNSSGDFVGVTNNSIALIPSLDDPTTSQWLTPETKVPEFVPLSDEEREFGKIHGDRGENKRFVNWAFGGIIEVPGGDGRGYDGREGWLFFDTVEIEGAEPVKQCGIGLAKARVTDTGSGHIVCERVGKFPLFDGDGPAWGNMSNISAPDGWTYLLTGRELDNYMARIRTDADFSNPQNYRFLNKGGVWASSYSAPYGPFGELAHDVLHGQGQGAILYLPEYAPHGKSYMWFGCGKFPTSELWVGTAKRPEGPWDVHSVGTMPKILGEQSNWRYCIYPHIWGSKLERGEVLITWSDNGVMGGKVAAGMFVFEME